MRDRTVREPSRPPRLGSSIEATSTTGPNPRRRRVATEGRPRRDKEVRLRGGMGVSNFTLRSSESMELHYPECAGSYDPG